MADKQNIPKGLSWIKAILVLGIIGGVLSLILKKIIFSSVGFLSGTLGDIFIIISLVIMILIWVGIHKRIDSFYKLALIWFGLEILLSLITLITSLFSLESFNQLSIPLIRILLNSLFVWYLLKRKDYFYAKEQLFNLEDPIIQSQEKIFKRILIAIFIIYLVFAMVGPKAFEMYQMVTIMKGVADKEVPVALDLCRAKSPSDKDYCIYKIVEFKKKSYDFRSGEVCEEISSSKYKNSCYLVLNQCSKITDENVKNICNSLSKLSTKTDTNSNLTQRP